MQKVINALLAQYLESNGLLSNKQCGFREEGSTLDHLVRSETFMRSAFTKKEYDVYISFDLEKVYDTTW